MTHNLISKDGRTAYTFTPNEQGEVMVQKHQKLGNDLHLNRVRGEWQNVSIAYARTLYLDYGKQGFRPVAAI